MISPVCGSRIHTPEKAAPGDTTCTGSPCVASARSVKE